MTTPFTMERRSPLKFFLLVFTLSIPLWLLGALTPFQLLPGLPVSSLAVFCPLIAASILVYRKDRIPGVAELLKRSFDFRRVRAKVWYIPAVLLMPGIAVLSYGLMRWLALPLPTPQFPGVEAVVLFLMVFIAALGEEIGWSGYVIDPMQDRWNALQASILMGLVWAAWHIMLLVQAGRSPAWIAWQCLNLMATRVLLVWLYNNTGRSVLAAALCHAMVNFSWQLFPNNGSHYDPRITGLITAFVALIVIIIWGPRTLTRNRNV